VSEGKTTISAAVAAAVTTGTGLPGKDIAIPRSNVIMQNSEDSYTKSIRPKLEMFGADLDMVHVIDTDEHEHDNNSAEDWHSLPFSGDINWNDIAAKLRSVSFNDAIALEIGNTKFEHIAKPDEFLKLAVESAERIRGLCNLK
jgi:hypothetical protein